jgi:hypothetical protein
MRKVLMILLFSLIAAQAKKIEKVYIKDQRGTYELNFNVTYVIYIHMDIETAVTLPPGYTFTASVPGSKDFISVGPVQNTMYISKPVNHDVTTNLTCHVLTPEGLKEKMVFEVIGKKKSPKIYAVHFTKPNTSLLNQAIEQIKANYSEQMAVKLSEQEKKLTTELPLETMINSRPLFMNTTRGSISSSYKGATVWIDGMINNDVDAFVYLRSDVKFENNNVIKLLEVKIKDIYNSKPELVKVGREGGTVTYVYKITKVPLTKKTPVEFTLKIWSKNFKIKHTIS